VGKRSRQAAATSHPDIPGIRMSLSTRSTGSTSHRATPSAPSRASITRYPSAVRSSLSTSRTSGSSSITSTRALFFGASATVVGGERHLGALAFDAKDEASAVRHGLQGVDEQIHERFAQLLRGARDERQRSPLDADLIRDPPAVCLDLPPGTRQRHYIGENLF